MKETDLKKEADKEFEDLFMRKDRGFDKDKDGYDILIFDLSKAGNVGVLINFYQDLIDKATLAERKRCSEIAHHFKRDARRLNGNPQWRHASEQYAKRIAKVIENEL